MTQQQQQQQQQAGDLPLPPVVILPGFGNAQEDYETPFNQPEEKGLVAALKRRGVADVTVLELPRWEWIRVAGGLIDPLFWVGTQKPEGVAYGWYVRRARATIAAASERAGGARVLVVAHSAGGWLARATLGDGSDWLLDDDSGGGDDDEEKQGQGQGREAVRRRAVTTVRPGSVVGALVTLGAPHFPPPAGAPPCATRGALAFCDATLPGAFLAESQGIAYVTVAGAAIVGDEARPGEGADPTLPARELVKSSGAVSAAKI
jgi:pimeloyl-ACP methyl ester carboxylesterase